MKIFNLGAGILSNLIVPVRVLFCIQMVESYDKKAEKEKAQKQKGSSSQTIIFKPADNTRYSVT